MQRSNIESIQLLRGFAALGVVLFHIGLRAQSIAPSDLGGALLTAFGSLGIFGVDVFFVISGFIIGTLVRKSESGVGEAIRFAVKRAFRIYPLYWVTILAAAILPIFIIPGWQLGILSALWQSATTLYTYHPTNPVTWTLTFEIRFYLVAALAVFAGRRAPLVFAVWASLQVAWVIATAAETLPRVDPFSDGISLEFLLGLLIAYMPWRLSYPRLVAIAAVVAAFLIGRTFPNRVVNADGLERFVGFGLPAAIVVLTAISWNAEVKTPRVFAFLGDISYSVYIWHWIMFLFTITWFTPVMGSNFGFASFFATELTLTLIVSTASFYLIEQPSNAFGSWFGDKLLNFSNFRLMRAGMESC